MFIAWLFYTTYETIKLGYYYTDSMKDPLLKSKATTSSFQSIDNVSQSFTPQVFSTKNKVGELPPEALAPMLKNPPKSPGGFGSRVKGD